MRDDDLYSHIFGMWVWVNTHRYIFSGMNIHQSQLFWGSLGTRVLTHPHVLKPPEMIQASLSLGALGFKRFLDLVLVG